MTGVVCQDGNDLHYIRVNASKGVILATGGYVSNTEMVEARQAWNNRLKINVPVGGSCTGDGVSINTDMHAVDEAGKQIEGLLMVGNDPGGFFSVSYPNLMTGLAAGRTMTFGRRAGMLAAQGK